MAVLIKLCTREAAKYAVMNWHYSKAMPSGKLVHYGVWEDGRFIGAVVFGRGATPTLSKSLHLEQQELCELVRVAMCAHTAPVTQVVAACLKQLKKDNPGLRLVVSFADPEHGHHGGIYQAGNWIYTGSSGYMRMGFILNGRLVHERSVAAMLRGRDRGGLSWIQWLRANVDPAAKEHHADGKHRYVYPLDRKMRAAMTKRAVPYPQRAAEVSRVTSHISGVGGQVQLLEAAP